MTERSVEVLAPRANLGEIFKRSIRISVMKANYQAMLSGKDPSPLFEKWRGGDAAIWEYQVSHMVFILAVTRPSSNLLLYVYCGDADHICGPTKWKNCELSCDALENDRVLLRDAGAAFELSAGVVGVEEAIAPWAR